MPANMRLFVPDPEGSDSYPIVTFSWVLLYHSYDQPAKAKAIRDLFGWSLSEGQKQAPALGYIPLPPNVTNRAQEVLNRIGPD
jgi:phosphate transport system substrate-binding protein